MAYMARKRNQIGDDLDGTVEKQALDFFEREKAAYEERTGERVEYVPAMPATRTPVVSETESEGRGDAETVDETEGEAS